MADGLVLLTGPGVGALVLVVPLAMAAALFLGSGQIFATQAAVCAVLIAALSRRATASRARASSTRSSAGASRC